MFKRMEPYTNVSATKIEQIQHQANKMVENFKDVSNTDRLHIIGMPTLQFRKTQNRHDSSI